MHANAHVIPSHVAVAFGGATHAVHDIAPHDVTEVLLTHAPAHECDVALHTDTQVARSHVAMAFAPAGHEFPHVPQFAGSV